MKHNNDVLLILKRARAKSREEEIAAFGKPIYNRPIVERNRKKYTRKIKHKGV